MHEAAGIPVPVDAAALIQRGRDTVDRRTLMARATSLARELPDAACVINLCQRREAFLTAFVAALVRGQTTLLPPNRARATIADLGRRYGPTYLVADTPQDGPDVPQHPLDLGRPGGAGPPPPAVAPGQVAAITFTSGTTGIPRANPKTWRSLAAGAALAARRFPFAGASILATVPAQHMYGLETSILVPLLCGAAVHDRRPLLPGDVEVALAELPAPRILVTTPFHLRACVEAGCRMPPLALVVSATAPLPAALAARAEAAWGAPVREIYGCTEGGSLASRRTVEGELWTPYDGIRLVEDGAAPVLAGGHLDAPVGVADVLEGDGSGCFRIVGRNADMVSVAGKRASLSDLSFRLRAIPGVEDGAFVPPEDGDRVGRLAALFVSRCLSEREVLSHLQDQLDPAFLPRPLVRVGALPRNELGKLPRAELMSLLRGARHRLQAP